MLEMIANREGPAEAVNEVHGEHGRFAEAVRHINPRKE